MKSRNCKASWQHMESWSLVCSIFVFGYGVRIFGSCQLASQDTCIRISTHFAYAHTRFVFSVFAWIIRNMTTCLNQPARSSIRRRQLFTTSFRLLYCSVLFALLLTIIACLYYLHISAVPYFRILFIFQQIIWKPVRRLGRRDANREIVSFVHAHARSGSKVGVWLKHEGPSFQFPPAP